VAQLLVAGKSLQATLQETPGNKVVLQDGGHVVGGLPILVKLSNELVTPLDESGATTGTRNHPELTEIAQAAPLPVDPGIPHGARGHPQKTSTPLLPANNDLVQVSFDGARLRAIGLPLQTDLDLPVHGSTPE
jgi:hypothetical protein